MTWCRRCRKEFGTASGPCPECGTPLWTIAHGQGPGTSQPLPPDLSLLNLEDPELTVELARQYGVPFLDLTAFELDREVLACVEPSFARERRIIPVNRTGSSLIVAMVDISDIFTIDALRKHTGLNIEVVAANPDAILNAIAHYYSGAPEV